MASHITLWALARLVSEDPLLLSKNSMACAPFGRAPAGPYIAFAEEVGADSMNVELLEKLCPGCGAMLDSIRPGLRDQLPTIKASLEAAKKEGDVQAFSLVLSDWMQVNSLPSDPSALRALVF